MRPPLPRIPGGGLVVQYRASLLLEASVIQKFTPSLQAPKGALPAPVGNVPIGVRSDALHKEMLLPF
jgi:hypothetical protein